MTRYETYFTKSARRDHCGSACVVPAADDFYVDVRRFAAVRPRHVPKGRVAAGAYAFCAGLYPARDAAPDWKKEQEGLEFSFGDYGEFTVEGVELDSVETSAKVTENGQETTEQHKFYRYSKSTAEGTTNP